MSLENLEKAQKQLLEERAKGLGGTDIQHLFDVLPYGCRRKLWYEKTGVAQDFPFGGNAHTERGIRLEGMAADLWAERHRRKLRRMGVRFHPEIPNLLVHIDRRILHPIQGHRTPGVLEVKCPSLFEFKRIKREGIGEAYILQMQYALAVTGWSWGFFAIFSAELWELIDFQVVREEKIIAKILEEGQRFWRLVENGPPPDRFPITEARCPKCPWRTTCQGEALLGARREEEGKWDSCELPLDENIGPLVNEFLEMKGLEEEASALTETAKARLQEALGNRQAVRAPGARIYYRATETKRIDTRALKIDLPEVAAKYERTSVVRSLRVYPD